MAARVFEDTLEAIGDTPLIRLRRVGAATGVRLYAKVEFFNPAGSVKDRVARHIVGEAERTGALRPGGTIVEATAGNTGAGLALVAAVKGYRCIFVLPDKMSEDKIAVLRGYGAEVVITPTAVAPDSPQSYNSVADRLAREIPGAYRANQFGNPANPAAHYATTGPEIWAALGDAIDAFIAGAGTGGTISGVGRYLKERKPGVRVVLADPEGSILSGDVPKSYMVEGIGEDFIPANFDRQVIDDFVRVSDRESFLTARRLAREEGLFVGGSAGTAAAAALRYAERLAAGATVVVLLPDTGRNYLSKLFSDEWMAAQGFLDDPALTRRRTLADVVARKPTPAALITVGPATILRDAIRLLETHNISQLPVVAEGKVQGQLDEVSILSALNRRVNPATTPVGDVMGLPPPALPAHASAAEAYRLLLAGHAGLVVTLEGDGGFAYITRTDLIRFWAEE